MFSPVYDAVAADAVVLATLGSPKPRVFSFGEAPPDVTRPYAVHQNVGGTPENYLGTLPDMDSLIEQIDVYGDTPAQVKAATLALVAPLEAVAYITSWNFEGRDPDTKLWRKSFSVEFKSSRT